MVFQQEISRNRRSASESTTRHAIPRSLSIPSKYRTM
jgi:hypothetical protein